MTQYHNGLQQPFDLGMQHAILGRAFIGDRPATAGEWAARVHQLALERAAAARELTIARIIDRDEWAAAAATGEHIDVPELREMALRAIMETP